MTSGLKVGCVGASQDQHVSFPSGGPSVVHNWSARAHFRRLPARGVGDLARAGLFVKWSFDMAALGTQDPVSAGVAPTPRWLAGRRGLPGPPNLDKSPGCLPSQPPDAKPSGALVKARASPIAAQWPPNGPLMGQHLEFLMGPIEAQSAPLGCA